MIGLEEFTAHVEAIVKDNPEYIGREDASAGTSLRDLGFDSLSIVDLVLAIEAQFNITLPDDLLVEEHFESVRSISEAIYPMYVKAVPR